MTPRNLVITGFKPFGHYRRNNTADAISILQTRGVPGFNLIPLIFPATINDADRGAHVLEIAVRHNACGIISLGMDSGAEGLRLESVTRNRIHHPKYCPRTNPTLVVANHEYDAEIRIPLTSWNHTRLLGKHRSQLNRTVMISTDAGGFCCNQLAFQVRARQLIDHQLHRIPFVLIHVPCSRKCVPNPTEHIRSRKIFMSPKQVAHDLELLLSVASL